jgi:hypothetical protein
MATPTSFLERTDSLELRTLIQKLALWRRTRRRGQRIPELLWHEASILARRNGVSSISAALKINYYDLQRRVRGERVVQKQPEAEPTFVQLPPAVLPPSVGEHGILEFVHTSGSRLILRLPAAEPSQLLALVQAFLRHRS